MLRCDAIWFGICCIRLLELTYLTQALKETDGFAPFRELARYRLRSASYTASAAWTGFSVDRFGLIELLAQLGIAHRQLAWLAVPGRDDQPHAHSSKAAARLISASTSRRRVNADRDSGQTLSELQPSDIAAVEMLSRRIAGEAATLMRHVASSSGGGSKDLNWLRYVNCEVRLTLSFD